MKLSLSVKTKFVIAVLIVIVSLVLGVYTKVLFFLHLPSYFDYWNLFWYIISWLMLIVAAFFVGKEMLEIADLYVKKKLQESYTLTLHLQKKGFKKGIATTKRGFEKTKKGLKTTHAFGKKTIAYHKKMLGIDEIDFRCFPKKRK